MSFNDLTMENYFISFFSGTNTRHTRLANTGARRGGARVKSEGHEGIPEDWRGKQMQSLSHNLPAPLAAAISSSHSNPQADLLLFHNVGGSEGGGGQESHTSVNTSSVTESILSAGVHLIHYRAKRQNVCHDLVLLLHTSHQHRLLELYFFQQCIYIAMISCSID